MVKESHIKTSNRESAFKLTELLHDPIDLTKHLPFRVAVVSNLLALNRDWKIREVCDLEPREMRVLLNIGSYMPIKSADIAYQSRMDSYTVSRAVKKLLALGLIETQPDAHKKNVKNLVLNQKGTVLYRRLSQSLEDRAQQLEDIFSVQELDMFYNLLEKIENKTEQYLAEQAKDLIDNGVEPPADQKELIRWAKKTNKG